MRIAIAGGGTAGHVNPALALAEELENEDVTFIGTAGGAEARSVPPAGFPLRTIEVSGFDRAKPAELPATLVRAARAVYSSRRLLKDLAPDVVVGMGGYVSLPVCLAASTRRVPIVLHEQNIVLGLANRVCRRVARRVAVSFAETLSEVGSKGIHTGNPISRTITTTDLRTARNSGITAFELDPDRKTVLIFGGSLGAERLNAAAIGLVDLWRERSDLQVLHICGPKHDQEMKARLRGGSGELIYRLTPYADQMIEAYAVADLTVCRGGATTVAELTCLGLPSVIVPYPFHRDRQQERHGRVLERAGAACVLLDSETRPDTVSSIVLELLGDPDALARMATAALDLGRPDAASALARVVEEVGR